MHVREFMSNKTLRQPLNRPWRANSGTVDVVRRFPQAFQDVRHVNIACIRIDQPQHYDSVQLQITINEFVQLVFGWVNIVELGVSKIKLACELTASASSTMS